MDWRQVADHATQLADLLGQVTKKLQKVAIRAASNDFRTWVSEAFAEGSRKLYAAIKRQAGETVDRSILVANGKPCESIGEAVHRRSAKLRRLWTRDADRLDRARWRVVELITRARAAPLTPGS